MKNKITLLIIALISNIYFINTAYSQNITNDACSFEYCAETPAPLVDCGIYDGYRYMSVGVGPIIFIPNLGLGYRERYAQFGWDAALSVSTIGYIHQLNVHLVGHYYFSPMRRNSAYIGLGLMGSEIFSNKRAEGSTLSPDFIFGKELEMCGNRRQFIEMHVNVPTVCFSSKYTESMYFPMMYVKYGISF